MTGRICEGIGERIDGCRVCLGGGVWGQDQADVGGGGEGASVKYAFV